jgi:hypothetical protein
MLEKIRLRKIITLLIIYFSVFNTSLFCQDHNINFNLKYNPSDTKEYWWLTKNSYGITKLQSQLTFDNNQVHTSYKIDISSDVNGKIYIGNSFIKHHFSEKTFIRIGKYYRDYSNYLTDILSSGHMLISNNAEPMPKVGFVTSKDFKRSNFISFNAGLSHGFFSTNSYYNKAPYLHEKFIYLNYEKNEHKFGIGMVHAAIWAGNITYEGGTIPNRNFPANIKNFLKVFIASDGEYEGGPHANALGNHLGIWDFFYENQINEKKIKLYYQHFFEDTSSLRFQNKTDGLWGIQIDNYIPNTIFLIEYLNTTNCCNNPPYQDDDYYGNYQYIDGWRYKNNIIGNAFVNTLDSSSIWIRNSNEIELLHLGIKGELKSYNYRMLASKKINNADYIKYRIDLSKSIKKSNLRLGLFIANNDSDNAIGISITKTL